MITGIQSFKEQNIINWAVLVLMIALFPVLLYYAFLKNITACIIIILVISGLYVVLVFQKKELSHKYLPLLLLLAVVLRLMFFGSDPKILSDDVFRYLWDGKIQVNQINPYLYPPNSEKLVHLRDETIYPGINHKQYRTIYPPLSQMIFFLTYRLGGSGLFTLRCIFLLFDFLLAVSLFGLTRSKKILYLYALCPLVIIETYLGMHIDIAGVALLTAALYSFKKKKWYTAAMLLALAIQVKYIALAAIPVFAIECFRESGVNVEFKKRLFSMVLLALVFTATSFALIIPYQKAGLKIFQQLFFYFRFWEFNSSVYSFMEYFFEQRTRMLIPLLYFLSVALIYFSKRIDPETKTELVVFILLLLTHTLFPWYLLWIVPFAIIRPKLSHWYLLIMVNVSYQVLIDYHAVGIWNEEPMIRLIEYVPFYLLFITDILRGKYVQKAPDCGDYSRA